MNKENALLLTNEISVNIYEKEFFNSLYYNDIRTPMRDACADRRR